MNKLKIENIKLIPKINSANKQINFCLKKSSLPKELRDKLPKLKSIDLKPCNFKFEDTFEEKWD